MTVSMTVSMMPACSPGRPGLLAAFSDGKAGCGPRVVITVYGGVVGVKVRHLRGKSGRSKRSSP